MLTAAFACLVSAFQDILRGAADEVLAVLKDDKKTDPERKREIEKLLGGISSEHFATLVVRYASAPGTNLLLILQHMRHQMFVPPLWSLVHP